MQNNITCSANCKHSSNTIYPKTWFVSGI